MSKSTPHQRPSKTMSSRLMTMKFMQRAAASITPTTPQSQSQIHDTQPSKRQKTYDAPSSTVTPLSDLQIIQTALDVEEEKREKATDILAKEAGETKWVLSTVNGEADEVNGGLRVLRAGYSEIDQEARRPAFVGRRSFGKFNRDLEKIQRSTRNDSASSSGSSSEASEEEDGEETDDLAGTRELIRASKEEAIKRANLQRGEKKSRRKVEKVELARLAEKRRSKGVKLNRLSSISGGGGGGGGGSKPGSDKLDRECYQCGQKGHEKRDCPQQGKRRKEGDSGRAPKRSRPSLDY